MPEPSFADYLEYISTTPPPPATISRFNTVPWVRRYMENTAYKAIPVFSRNPNNHGENNYFSKTVNSPTTIPHWLCMMRKDFSTLAEEPRQASQPRVSMLSGPAPNGQEQAPEYPDCVLILELGSDLNGFPDTVHGGVLCAILDESLSLAVETHRQLTGNGRTELFTAQLNITYRAPVMAPSIVAVKTWLASRQGRKWYMRGQVENEHGNILTEATGLWIAAKEASM